MSKEKVLRLTSEFDIPCSVFKIQLLQPKKTENIKMNFVKTDILTRTEVKILVDSFYEKVKRDSLLGPVFSHVNWPHHLPIMYNFWSSMLLGDQTYRGNPLQKHLNLAIDKTHFQQWLVLFKETVDENFEGDKANEVKMRAGAIARVFQVKMGL